MPPAGEIPGCLNFLFSIYLSVPIGSAKEPGGRGKLEAPPSTLTHIISFKNAEQYKNRITYPPTKNKKIPAGAATNKYKKVLPPP